jgi:hypothetical protein
VKNIKDLKLFQNKMLIMCINQDKYHDSTLYINSLSNFLGESYLTFLIWVGENKCSEKCHPLETLSTGKTTTSMSSTFYDLGHQNYIDLSKNMSLLGLEKQIVFITLGLPLLDKSIQENCESKIKGHLCVLLNEINIQTTLFEMKALATDQELVENFLPIDAVIIQAAIDKISLIDYFDGSHKLYTQLDNEYGKKSVSIADKSRIIQTINQIYKSSE